MRRTAFLLAALAVATTTAAAQSFSPDSAFLAAFQWRSIGPANMAGRVADVRANPLNPKVIYVAFATGGVWRSRNAGTTWESIFDSTGVGAGAQIAIAPSDTNVIWVGTGEANSRNSISPGAGVFRSTNGGDTWTFVGLAATQHIGRIVVHPNDPNTAWVAALGHAWGPNPERGIYKTTDGGQTWRKVLFVSNQAGAVDIAMDPANPDVLLASTWQRVRGPWFLNSGGPGSGLWRSTDGGEHWTRVTQGLPTTTLGRIGVAFAPSNHLVAYALVEADSNPNPASLRRGFVPDSTKRQHLQSGLFRSEDGGLSWTRMNTDNNRPFYYSQVRVDPQNPDRVYWVSMRARFSNDGGRSWRMVGQPIHVDFHALWIDPNDPDHYITGSDGGVSQTFDRGRTYDAILQMAVGQFYAVGVDMQRPFWVCGGLQDNGSWCGPSESLRGGISNQDWTNVGGGDGFRAQIDPTNPDIVYSESQGGNISRLDMRTWSRESIRPDGRGFGGSPLERALEDSIALALPDSVNQRRQIAAWRARITQDTSALTTDRFNWEAPYRISTHNPNTLYMGGQRLWKTVDRGDHWVAISGDLSTRDSAKIYTSMVTTGGITNDATTAETHGTITTVAESPVRPGILWVGTDDGNVWLTKNDGVTWENITNRFPGKPANTWVSRVEASYADSATVYVTFDGHMTDDFHPYVYVSTDFGRTFRSITNGLPDNEYVHVIREDPRRPDLLFLGTEHTAWVSADRGASWHRLNTGLPPVPVHDLVIHPRDRELVAGTHGRSVYVMDIGPLEEATDSVLAAPAHLFAIEPALLYNRRGGGGSVGLPGSKYFEADNPPFGAHIPLRIVNGEQPRRMARGGRDTTQAEAGPGQGRGGFGGGDPLAALMRGDRGTPPGDTVVVVITNVAGDTVRTIRTNARVSELRWINWDLRADPGPSSPSQVRDSVITADRRAALRDSLRAVMRDSTNTNRPRLRDPEPHEPGNWENPALRDIDIPGGGFGGFRRFRGRGFVDPGEYLVSVTLNGVTYHQTVTVMRPEQPSALGAGWQ